MERVGTTNTNHSKYNAYLKDTAKMNLKISKNYTLYFGFEMQHYNQQKQYNQNILI
jgi:hypothetical protein